MKAYSLDLRQKILRAHERGVGWQAKLAALFGVSQSFVEKLLMRLRHTGDMAAKAHAGGRPSRLDAVAREQLRQWLTEQPDLTLGELVDRLAQRLAIQISVSRLCQVLQELGLPRIKSRSTRANATARR